MTITLVEVETGAPPANPFTQPGPEYSVTATIQGARCPRHPVQAQRRKCLTVSGKVSGLGIRLPSNPDWPSMIQITAASGHVSALGQVTGQGALTGTGFVARGSRAIWITFTGADGAITLGGHGPPVEGFEPA